jgi:hypothetical protein
MMQLGWPHFCWASGTRRREALWQADVITLNLQPIHSASASRPPAKTVFLPCHHDMWMRLVFRQGTCVWFVIQLLSGINDCGAEHRVRHLTKMRRIRSFLGQGRSRALCKHQIWEKYNARFTIHDRLDFLIESADSPHTNLFHPE